VAICYACGERFYGTYCGFCGWEAEYSCWSCGETVSPSTDAHCRLCGWFVCSSCAACGCADDRPPSREEEEDEAHV
jgi:hypothetical protein